MCLRREPCSRLRSEASGSQLQKQDPDHKYNLGSLRTIKDLHIEKITYAGHMDGNHQDLSISNKLCVYNGEDRRTLT